jgi:putative DNA primase/helicase
MATVATPAQLEAHKKQLLESALYYASLGLHVIPLHTPGQDKSGKRCSCRDGINCEKIGKHPRISDWPNKASIEEKQIREWWNTWPIANIGILCGEKSNLFVFDVDGEEGRNSIKERDIPETVTTITGKGNHYLYTHPKDTKLKTPKNSVGIIEGCDIRTNRGYIVAPPSMHYSGKKYRWQEGHAPNEIELANAPQWLLDKFKEAENSVSPKEAKTPANPKNGNTTAYGKAALQDACEKIRNAREYTRNQTLNDEALCIAQLVAGGEVNRIEAKKALGNAALKAGLGQSEIISTLNSAFRAGEQNPRTPKNDITTDDNSDFPLTELGNAERFVSQHKEYVKYVPAWGWLIWNGKYWERDKLEHVRHLAHKTVKNILVEANDEKDRDKSARLARWAITSQSSAKITALLREVQALEEDKVSGKVVVKANSAIFDKSPMLLNCSNGTINFTENGYLQPHNKADMITKIAPVDYKKEADCPTWLAFLDKIMAGNKDLIAFIQRAIGYTLTAKTNEQAIFFCYGTGANGKSTLFNIIAALLGDYSRKISFDSLLEKQKSGSTATSDLARLAGARFVYASEPDVGKSLSESLLKELTSSEPITVRELYKPEFEFKPEFKLWIAANHKPQIKGQDHGIWRRIKLIPFEVTIPDHEQDKHLEEKLMAELSGIFNWAIEGALLWKLEGLAEPPEVIDATDLYKVESDILADFIADKVSKGPNKHILVADCYHEYTKYCLSNGERVISKRAFANAMRERGFLTSSGSGNKTLFVGIDLKAA